MGKNNKVTAEKFNMVKTLNKGGASAAKISEYVDLSRNTIYNINKSETYEDYQKFVVERKNRRVKESSPESSEETSGESTKVVEHRQTITIQATYYMMQELQKTNKLLTEISAKLAFIVEQLS